MSGDLISFNFVGPAYETISLPYSAQQCINLYLENAQEAARSQEALISTPGSKAFVTLTDSPVRVGGMREFAGSLYVVSGQTLFKIEANGSFQSLGTVPGSSSVSISNNLSQLIVVNGQEGFIYTPASDAFVQITDPDFRPADVVTFLDQYFVLHETDSPRFFISALANGLAYDGLDFGTKEGSPDDIRSLLADHRDLLLFGGQFSTELWENTGAEDFPFEVQNGVFIERASGAKDSSLQMDNQVYWLGDDKIVYHLDGYLPAKTSTYAIDERIRQYETIDDAFAFTYTEGGHFFYVLTFPTGDETWVYDASTRKWHQRSTGLRGGRWFPNAHARFNNRDYAGDSQSGKILELDLDTYTEDGETIRRVRTAMPQANSEKPLFVAKLQILFEAGIGLLTGQGSDPIAALDVSDDGGRTYKNPKFRSMGKIGEYKRRSVWRRRGRFRDRVHRLTVTDPIKVVIIDASIEAEPGF